MSLDLLDLLDHERDALREIIRAGGDGLELTDRLPVSVAIRLALSGLVKIEGDPQRAIVTARGASFARQRSAA